MAPRAREYYKYICRQKLYAKYVFEVVCDQGVEESVEIGAVLSDQHFLVEFGEFITVLFEFYKFRFVLIT